MTTLATGSSVTVTLANNGFLEVATSGGFGSVTITPTNGSAVVESFGPGPFRKRWPGSYPEGATAVLRNDSCASWDYETDSSNLPASVQALVSGAGNSGALPVMLVGDSNTAFGWDSGPTCTAIADNGDGTATITFNASHNWAVGSRITVNSAPVASLNRFNAPVVGIVNTNPYTVTYQLTGRFSPVTGAAAANTQTLHMGRYAPIGYPAWLEALSGRRLGYLLAAAGGADSTQALTLYNDAIPEAQASGVSDVVLMIGTNDVFARAWDFPTAQANIKALADRIRATMPGRLWWVMTIPMGSGGAAWSAGKQTVLNRLIRWMWRYATQIGATPIDSWRGTQNGSTLVNAGASNPDPTANFLGADATHTTNLGALCIARAILAQWNRVQPTLGLGFQGGHAAVQNQGNALTNSRLTGTAGTKTPGGGTITGSAPDSWTVEITSGTGTLTLTNPARTVAADGDADGNNLSVAISVAAASWRLMNTSSLHTAVTAGEVRDAYVPITITGAAGLTGIELILFGAKSSGGNENLGFAGVSQAITGDISLCLRIPRWVVPSGLTSLSFFVRFTGGTAGTFVIGKPCLELVE